MNNSPIFNKLYDSTSPDSSFDLRGSHYRFGYYLVDGIYLERLVFVKKLPCPDDNRMIRFKRAQEKSRKDVEQAFRALKKHWHIIRNPSIFNDKVTMMEVMYTCIILHNMIIEDEGTTICDYNEHEVIPKTQQLEIGGDVYMYRHVIVHNSEIHHDLHRDLTDHLWTLDNLDLNMSPLDELDG